VEWIRGKEEVAQLLSAAEGGDGGKATVMDAHGMSASIGSTPFLLGGRVRRGVQCEMIETDKGRHTCVHVQRRTRTVW
jgi:hypothetical protein